MYLFSLVLFYLHTSLNPLSIPEQFMNLLDREDVQDSSTITRPVLPQIYLEDDPPVNNADGSGSGS